MEITRLMDCGDANRRADNGAFFGLNDITSAAGTGVSAKTANYTVTAAETGKAFSNAGAGGAVQFTLPTPKPGMWFCFFKLAQQNLTIAAGAGITVNGASTFANTAAENNKSCIMVATSTTNWATMASFGTWTVA